MPACQHLATLLANVMSLQASGWRCSLPLDLLLDHVNRPTSPGTHVPLASRWWHGFISSCLHLGYRVLSSKQP